MSFSRFNIEIISQKDLCEKFEEYKPNFERSEIKEIFDKTLELCHDTPNTHFTNVIHLCYDLQEERYCAILNIGTTTSVDDIVSIHVEFLFVEPEYRMHTKNKKHTFEELGFIKLSEYLLVDYVVGTIGMNSKKVLGIGLVALTPVNDDVREIYKSYGFDAIKGSGPNEFEDWMIFNIP